MPKENCKYWDKCYQKNEYHLNKYNHPEKKTIDADEEAAGTSTIKEEVKCPSKTEGELAPKRKADDTVATTTGTSKNVDKNAKYDVAGLRAEALSNIAGKNYMEMIEKRIKLSIEKEYEELLRSNEFIRYKFLVEMPTDFYAFWKYVLGSKKDATGEELLQYMDKVYQIQLVGPFEYLAGRFNKAPIREPGDYLRHWRFFYDPPEFQTIFVRSGTGIHYGYWRDTPQDKEGLLIARNDADTNCEFEFVGGNVFEAFVYFLRVDYPSTPFTSATINSTRKSISKFTETLHMKLHSLKSLNEVRNSKVVAKTLHRAGIVVPFNPKTKLGYRPLIISDAEIKKIIKLFDQDENDPEMKTVVIGKLQPATTAALIAVDECDFGTALELGMNLFCSGRIQLHKLAQSLLVPAYSLLSRPQFIAIVKAHMEQRWRTESLSLFDL